MSGTHAQQLARLGLSDRQDLAQLMDASFDCIKVIDRGGNLAFMNEGGQCVMEIADFSAIEGAKWSDLWPEENQHLIEDAVERAFAGESVRLEAFCPTALGRPRWWDVSVSPMVQDGDVTCLLSISRDITDRVRREQRAEERERMAVKELKKAKKKLGKRVKTPEPEHSARVGPEAQRQADKREARRLDALDRLGVLDTTPNATLDRLTALAAKTLGCPTALVSLVDAERQWFKSRVGMEACETPREQSFCSIAIRRPEDALVIEDASQDQRTLNNPLVTADGGIRAYAGIPLVTSDGKAMGSFCVIDTEPRTFSEDDIEALRTFAAAAVAEMEREALARRANRLELVSAEMRHRMGNTYAQVASLVGLLAKSAPDKDALADALRENITALSRTQARIAQGEWVSLDLCALLEETLHTSDPEARFDCHIDPNLDVAPQAAFLFTLALQELATNSRKHGALGTADARVGVEITSDDDRLTLVWTEGAATSDAPKAATPSSGFGSRLLTRIVPMGLGGGASLEIRPDGMRYELSAPRARIEA